jgi:hypothetical protein
VVGVTFQGLGLRLCFRVWRVKLCFRVCGLGLCFRGYLGVVFYGLGFGVML